MRRVFEVLIAVGMLALAFLFGLVAGVSGSKCKRDHEIPWIIEQPCPGDKGFQGYKDGNSV